MRCLLTLLVTLLTITCAGPVRDPGPALTMECFRVGIYSGQVVIREQVGGLLHCTVRLEVDGAPIRVGDRAEQWP